MNTQDGRFAATIAWIDGNKAFFAKVLYVLLAVVSLVGIPAWPAISHKFSLSEEDGVALLAGVVIAYMGIMLSLVVEIHRKSASTETWFASHQESLDAIREALGSAVKERRCKLTWIGVSLQSAWLALEQILRGIEESSLTNVQITLLQSEPGFLRRLDESNDGLAGISEGQFQYMKQRCESMRSTLEASRSQIVIAQYSYMPNIHGVLIGDQILFLSFVRWQGRARSELSVPREPFERLSDQTPRGRYAIELYRSWQERALQSAAKENRVFVFPEARAEPSRRV